MNKILILILLLLTICNAKTDKIDINKDSTKIVINNLKEIKLNRISGQAVGYSGSPGIFYLSGEYLIKHGNEQLYLELLKDKNPTIQFLGLYCLANKDSVKYDSILIKYIKDTTTAEYQPLGCSITEEKLGNIVKILRKNIRFLSYERKNIKDTVNKKGR
jgi:hypothetical protein